MISPTSGDDMGRAYFARDFFTSVRRNGAGRVADLAIVLVVAGDPLEQLDRAAIARPVPQARDRQPPDGVVRVARGELVEQRAKGVDVAGVIRGKRAERDQRRAARTRALVLEPAPQELELLAKAKLSDRAVRDAAHAVVGVARRRLELVVPFRPQVRELALLPRRASELLRLGGGLCEVHSTAVRERAAGPTYVADGRKSRPVRFCSRMCADQPATREHANIAGASGGGISAMSSTTAE